MAVIQNPLDIDMAQRAPIIIIIKMAAVLIGTKDSSRMELADSSMNRYCVFHGDVCRHLTLNGWVFM